MQQTSKSDIERQKLLNQTLSLPNHNILLELATSTGKSRIAIEKIKQWYNNYKDKEKFKVLIVVPKLVLIENWKKELAKWDADFIPIEFTTYISVGNKLNSDNYTVCLYDEAHHLTERNYIAILSQQSYYNLFLTATLPKDKRKLLYSLFKNIGGVTKQLKEAVEDNVIPTPIIITIPLFLDKVNKIYPATYGKGRTAMLTAEKYYEYLSNRVEYLKNQYQSNTDYKRRTWMRNSWLHSCGDRLKWLGSLKLNTCRRIIDCIEDYRTIIFAYNIEQCKSLCEHSIHSKLNIDKVNELVEQFNNGDIDMISSCAMLNEGINLVNCQIGLFCNLNSSEVFIAQKLGRILRHKQPFIIIPYYSNTREEELMNKVLDNFKGCRQVSVSTPKELKNFINYALEHNNNNSVNNVNI